ncbi:MAG: sulfatase [Armatimonadetes bacterium]|nr:sulfatase [Armatimonadota bacterium]
MNIILIVCDSWRRDFLGCYGATEVETPHLDRFAQEAVVFDHAYAASFPTLPCRAELFTGKFVFPYLTWGALPAGEVVLADCLSRRHYQTAMVLDNLPVSRLDYGYDRGFHTRVRVRGQWYDDWAPPDTPVRWPAPKEKMGWPNRVEQYLRNVAARKCLEDYFAPRVYQAAIDWLERFAAQGPFFLYLDGFDPHEPWDPPEQFLREPIPEGERLIYPKFGRAGIYSPEELRRIRALYGGEVRMVDQCLGRLRAAIDRLGLRETTAVIFLSDHGVFLGEHNLLGKANRQRQDVNGWPPYREVAAIPLLMRIPGVVPRRVEALVHPGDLMPTVLELAGVQIPPTVRARSLLAVARGEQDEIRDVAITGWSYGARKGYRPTCIRTRDWSLVWWRTGIRPELYDRCSDAGETRDVFAEHPEVARELHARYVRFLKEQRVPPKNYWSRRFFFIWTKP